MKTEDIDKKIGMPDVDAEWARFEQEVIDKETKTGKQLWLWGLSIAASIIIAACLFLLRYDFKEQEQLLAEHLAEQEKPYAPERSEEPVETIKIVEEQVVVPRKKLAQAETPRLPKTQDKESAKTDLFNYTEPLQGVIAGRENIDPNYNDSILVLLDGKQLPDSLCTRDFARHGIHSYLEKKGLKAKKIVRLNEESVRLRGDEQAKQRYMQYVEQYGRLAQLGVTEITSANDSANEVFILQHPELMKTFRRVEGFVVEESTNEPLEFTIVRYRQFATSADSIGHFVLWVPKSVDTLYTKCIGYQDAFFQPADTTLTIRLKDNYRMNYAPKIAESELQDIALADLGSGTTMHLRGTEDNGPSDKDRMDSTLILVNGEPLPEHLKQEILGNNPDDIDTHMPRYFSRQGLLIDSVYVRKDSNYTEKYGGRAKYGVIEIKTVPDTYCDAYVRKHPKLMKKYTKVEGYVVDNDSKPLTEAWVHIKEDDLIGAPTDSTGRFVFWIPKKDAKLCANQTGYKTVEFLPTDTTLTIRLQKATSKSIRLR